MKNHFVPQVKKPRERYWTTLGLDMGLLEAVEMMLDHIQGDLMGRVLCVSMNRAPAVVWRRNPE